MNYTGLFYWLVVADNARTFFVVMIVIYTAIAVISTVCNFICADDGNKEGRDLSRRWIWWSYPFCILFWLLFIFTPNKRDALLIVAGGTTLNFLANDKSAKQIPAEVSGFLLTEIKNLAKDAEVDLNIANQKDKVLEKAKTMTAEQLMSEMKKDSTFAKLILEK